MKKLANLKGAKALSKKEQKSIIGGVVQACPPGYKNCENLTFCTPIKLVCPE